MKTQTAFFINLCFCIFSCNPLPKVSDSVIFEPKITIANGYKPPKENIEIPKQIAAGIPKIIEAGTPEIIAANTNIHTSNNPKIVQVGTPKICIMGTDSFRFPKTFLFIEKKISLGIPEVTIVKEASTKDPNPHSFNTFRNLQGLRHGQIRCMLEDYLGNIWLGTYGGGICRYDGKTFTHYSGERVSKYNFVKCMIQDKTGNIWFGTSGEGIIKYDGKTFSHLTISGGLGATGIESIMEDHLGNIWLSTAEKGVFMFDGQSFTQFTTHEGLNTNFISSVLEDNLGHLWFGSLGGGLTKYDGKSFTHFTEKEGLINNVVRKIMEDNEGNLWIGTNGGVCKYDGKNFTHLTKKEGLSDDNILTILQDNSGIYWFGTHTGGISKYDGKTFAHFTKNEGLSDNGILSILQDRIGNLWFGTNGEGVSLYNGKRFNHFTEKEGLSHDRVVSIINDRSGNLWFGTYGKGVSKYDGKTFFHYTETQGLISNFIYCMVEDRNGNIWFGTDGSGACKYDGKNFIHFTKKEGLSHNIISTLFEDRHGNIWFGTFGGGVCKYDGKTFTHFGEKEGLYDNSIYSICEDNSGNLWFATFTKGVVQFDGTSFTYFGENEGLSNNFISSVLKDKNGNLWFGTYGSGVNKYDGKTFTHYTEKEGLSNNFIYSMFEDKSGNIWFGTRFGISKFNQTNQGTGNIHTSDSIVKSTIYFTNYTYEDGFLGIGCARSALCEDQNGRIWIGANDRLTVYQPPQKNAKGHIYKPNIQLTGIALFNENIDWINLNYKKDSVITLGNGVKIQGAYFNDLSKWYNLPEKLSLAHDNNYISFNFIGITMKQPQKVKYQYKLEGNDENWSAITTRTEAPYGNLANGTYTFKVKAISSDGFWSDEFSYTFTVRPPWYRTWWAYLLWIAATFGISYILYRFMLNRRLQQAEAIRLKELDAVKTRLYTNITHEFRTPLTVILGMADQMIKDPKEWFHDGIRIVQRNGKQLLQLVNQMLDLSKLESGTMSIQWQQSDIIGYVRYIHESFHSLAAGRHIDLNIQSDKKAFYMDFDPEKIRNIVSNLLSNAIKYTPEGGHVTVYLTTEGGILKMSVSDTGIGIPADKLPHIFDRFYQVDDTYTRKAEGTGIGLTLTKELIQLLGGTIDVKSTPGKGSEFVVTLPITHHAPSSQLETAMPLESAPTELVPTNREGVLILETSDKTAQKKPLVLLVEDNPDVVNYLRICLKKDYQLEWASNGLEGLNKSLELIPDLIVSDVMMPEMDGYELCQKLKTHLETSHIPIVLLTAKADMDSKIAGLELGADEYLAKPFEERELKARLKNLLNQRRALQERYGAPAYWQAEKTTPPTLDDIFLNDLKTFIENHIDDTDLDVHHLEKAFNMSRTKLHRKLTALTNMSATEYIRFIRLTKAADILRGSPELTVSEVAYAVGFTSLSYFTRRFTEVFGESPTHWREG